MTVKPRLSTVEAVDYLASLGTPFSRKTLESWRSRRTGPEYVTVSGKIFYPREALERFAMGSPVRTLDSVEGR